MRTLALLLAFLLASPATAGAQDVQAPEGVPIQSADVSGLPLGQLSPGIRQAIADLVGAPLSRQQIDDLVARIEGEHPDVVAAARTIPLPDARARVVFLVARISDDSRLASDINTRYTVESVSLSGVPESRVSQALRDQLQTLVGDRLNPEQADRIRERLAAELPGHRVRRRVSRGSQPGWIRVTFDVTTPPMIPFTPSRSKFLYHGDQGWTGVLDMAMAGGDHRFVVGLVLGDKDDLVEHYRGYRLRAESRRIASERIGASVEFSWLRQSWEQVTRMALAADPALPDVYRTRRTIEPSITVALDRHVRVSAGLSTSELEAVIPATASRMANAMTASIGYDQRWRRGTRNHRVEASYLLRATRDALGSDLSYRRHLAQARYLYQEGKNTVIAGVSFGRITGQAPFFERFSLGDSSTLRGWNKYDIAPAGADHMVHQSIEYRHRHVAWFLDSGSVWNRGSDARLRLSTGFGYHGDNAFVTLGFPLNADSVSATFMMGVRF